MPKLAKTSLVRGKGDAVSFSAKVNSLCKTGIIVAVATAVFSPQVASGYCYPAVIRKVTFLTHTLKLCVCSSCVTVISAPTSEDQGVTSEDT